MKLRRSKSENDIVRKMDNKETTNKDNTVDIKRSSSLSARRKSLVKLKSRASLDKPLRKLSFQIKSNIKDLMTRNESSEPNTEPQSPVDSNKHRGFLNAFQLNAKTPQSQKRVILNVGGVKHEGKK